MLRRRFDPRPGLVRVSRSSPAILQIVAAATAAYAFSHFVLDHRYAVLSVTVTISSLGFGRDARPKRVAETAFGMILGIALSETLQNLWGTGVWQLAVALAGTLVVARFLSPTATFAVAAGVQAMLVTVLPAATPGDGYTRSIDGIVGGIAALVFTAILPRSPVRAVRRDARRLVVELSTSLAELSSALRTADLPAAHRTLERLRATQPLVDEWASSLDSAVGVARISPFLGRHLGELERQRDLQRALDLATRNLRVVARRAEFLVRDGTPRPELAELTASVSSGVNLVGRCLTDPTAVVLARQDLILMNARLDPDRAVPDGRIADKTFVMILRPLVVDLLVATGMSDDEARATLPSVS